MITIKNISKLFDEKKILDNLSLAIQDQESMVIIGRSGCGKSVLLKHIIGLILPDKGEILINNVNINKISRKELTKLRMDFGMLFQGSALFDSLNVFENIGFRLLEFTDMDIKDVKKRVAECLEMVGLKGIEQLKTNELSGGMKKRVALARAISMNPKIILFDEPTTGLDPIMSDLINNLISDLHKRLKLTSIVVTHDMKSAYKLADRIAMLYDKKIMEINTPENIKKSKNPIIRQFIEGRYSV